MTTDPTPLRLRQRGEGWHLEPRRHRMFKAGGVLVLVAFAVGGLSRLADGHPIQGVGLAVVGVAFGVIPFDRNDQSLPARTVEVDGERGLLLPTHPAKVSTILAMAVLGLVVLGVAGAAVVVGARDDKPGGMVAGVIIGAFGALLLLGVLGAVQGRRARDRGVLLLPGAVVLRTGRRPTRLPWDQIAGFRDHWSRPGRKFLWTEITDQVDSWLSVEPGPSADWPPDPLRAFSGTTDPTIRATMLAVDPVVALAVLRLHLQRPDLRVELGSERALQRVDELR